MNQAITPISPRFHNLAESPSVDQSDRHTLLSLSLVSQDFTSPAQTTLWKNCQIAGSVELNNILGSPALGRFQTQRLIFSGLGKEIQDSWIDPQLLSLLLDRMHALRELWLDRITISANLLNRANLKGECNLKTDHQKLLD